MLHSHYWQKLIWFFICLQAKNCEASLKTYWEYSSAVKTANYIFMKQMAFIIFACSNIIFNRNANELLWIYKLSILLFGFNHPNYYQLISFEKNIEFWMPSWSPCSEILIACYKSDRKIKTSVSWCNY